MGSVFWSRVETRAFGYQGGADLAFFVNLETRQALYRRFHNLSCPIKLQRTNRRIIGLINGIGPAEGVIYFAVFNVRLDDELRRQSFDDRIFRDAQFHDCGADNNARHGSRLLWRGRSGDR